MKGSESKIEEKLKERKLNENAKKLTSKLRYTNPMFDEWVWIFSHIEGMIAC